MLGLSRMDVGRKARVELGRVLLVLCWIKVSNLRRYLDKHELEREEYSGLSEDVCTTGTTATILSGSSLFLLVLVRHTLVPLGHCKHDEH